MATKIRLQQTLGYTVKLEVPASLDYAREKYGDDIILESFVDENIFRGNLPGIRKTFVELIENEGFKRKTSDGPLKKDGTPTVIYESPDVFIKRMKAESGITPERQQELVQIAADKNPFDPTASTSSRLGKKFINAAEGLAAAVEQGVADWGTVIANFNNELPNFVFEFEADGSTPTIESLAYAIKADEQKRELEAQNKWLKK